MADRKINRDLNQLCSRTYQMIIINHNVGQKCGAMTCDYKDHIMNNKMQGKYQIYTHEVSPKI